MVIAYLVSQPHWRVDREIQALNALPQNNVYEYVFFDDLQIIINQENINIINMKNGQSLLDYDLVYCRGVIGGEEIRNAVGMIFNHAGKPFINEEVGVTQYTSKLWQYIQFQFESLPFPPTIVASGKLIAGGRIVVPCDGPIVVKATRASNGTENYLLNSLSEFSGKEDLLYCIQPFIPNSFDYRIIVAEEEILLAYKRIRQDSETHLNNVEQGGQREIMANLNVSTIELAIAAAKSVKRNLAGVDVLVADDGKEHLLEVNFNYGIPTIEGEEWERYVTGLDEFFSRKAMS